MPEKFPSQKNAPHQPRIFSKKSRVLATGLLAGISAAGEVPADPPDEYFEENIDAPIVVQETNWHPFVLPATKTEAPIVITTPEILLQNIGVVTERLGVSETQRHVLAAMYTVAADTEYFYLLEKHFSEMRNVFATSPETYTNAWVHIAGHYPITTALQFEDNKEARAYLKILPAEDLIATYYTAIERRKARQRSENPTPKSIEDLDTFDVMETQKHILPWLFNTFNNRFVSIILMQYEHFYDTKGGVLHSQNEYIQKHFNTEELVALMYEIYSMPDHTISDVFTPLALARHLKRRRAELQCEDPHNTSEESAHLCVSVTDVMERAVAAFVSYPESHIILQRIADVQNILGRKHSLDAFIVPALTRCVEKKCHRAVTEQLPLIKESIENTNILQATLRRVVEQAYTEGDLPSFLHAYNELDAEQQAAARYMYDFLTTGYTEEQINHLQEFWNTEPAPDHNIKIGTLFSAEHLPFERTYIHPQLQHILAQAKEKTKRTKLVGGVSVVSDYGHTFFDAPLVNIETILLSPAFTDGIQSIGGVLSYGNVFMLAESVHEYIETQYGSAALLGGNDTPPHLSEETIHTAITHIGEHLSNPERVVLLSPNTQFIIASHDEWPDTKGLARVLLAISGGSDEKVLYHGAGNTQVKDRTLHAIRTAHGEVAIVLNGHGLPGAIYLSGNDGIAQSHTGIQDETQKNEGQNRITAEELAQALIDSGNISQTRLIVSACYSKDFMRNVFTRLSYLGESARPQFTITDGDTSRVSYYKTNVATEGFDAKFLIDTLAAHALDNPTPSLTLQNVLETQTDLLLLERVGVESATPPTEKEENIIDTTRDTIEIVSNDNTVTAA
jgi:hypothetical protein